MPYDVRLAFASLKREPLLSALVILILAVGLGVHTAVFGLVNAAFFKPLPFATEDRLVVVSSVSAKTGGTYGLSIPDADDYQASVTRLLDVGALTARRDNLISDDQQVLSLSSALVTSGVLPSTGVQPLMGRIFEQQDDQQGADSAKVLISHRLWRSHFGGDEQILGKTLRTSLGTFSILGVLPSGFGFPNDTDLWFPYQSWIDSQDSGDLRSDSRGLRWAMGVGLLAEGATRAQAQAELEGLARSLGDQYPESNADWEPRVTAYREHTTTGLTPHLRSLFAMTWVFLILAAVNLAGLQLARGVARISTFSLQLALGARGLSLVRQLLIETLVLAIPGAVLGVLLAQGLLGLLPRLVPTSLPAWLDIRVGALEVGFALSAGLIVSLIAGLAPLWIGRRLDLRSLLAGRSKSAPGGRRLRSFLVVAQVALAAVLLVAAGLLARSFGTLSSIDPGFETENIVAVELSPQHQGSYLEQTDSLAALYRRVQARLLEVPGVEAVGGTTHLPYLDRSRRPVKLLARGGEDEEALEHQAPILTIDATPGYFESMGIPIVEGRDFRWSDVREDGLVIILSRRAAEQLFPGQNAVGKEARIASDSWARVIGVVGDVRFDPRETDFGAELYYPITQYKAWRQRLTVRLDGSLEAFLPSLRAAFQEAAPEAGIVEFRTLPSILDESLWQARLLGRLGPLFAGVALLLAGLGVYGLMAHDLAQKRQELGLRAALGAPVHSLAGLILWRGARLISIGVAVGVVVAIFASPVLSASLFGVEARDPATLVLAASSLLAAGLLASLAPSWRATRVPPTESLRDV